MSRDEVIRSKQTKAFFVKCPLTFVGIDLENIVYYRDNTHYFVMTAKKQSLLDKGVIISVSIHGYYGAAESPRERRSLRILF